MGNTRTATKNSAGINIWEGAIVVVAAILLIGSTLGPDWLYSPADPKTGTPAATLDFSALGVATEGSPSAIQATYFGWLAWVAFIGVIVLGALTALSANRLWAIAGLVAGLIAVLVSVLAIKGPLTWSQTVDALPNIRLGGYMMIIGLLGLLAYSAFRTFVPRPVPLR